MNGANSKKKKKAAKPVTNGERTNVFVFARLRQTENLMLAVFIVVHITLFLHVDHRRGRRLVGSIVHGITVVGSIGSTARERRRRCRRARLSGGTTAGTYKNTGTMHGSRNLTRRGTVAATSPDE